MKNVGHAQEWERWRDYYQKRNDIAHEYDLVKFQELPKVLPAFISDVEFLIANLKEKLNND